MFFPRLSSSSFLACPGRKYVKDMQNVLSNNGKLKCNEKKQRLRAFFLIDAIRCDYCAGDILNECRHAKVLVKRFDYGCSLCYFNGRRIKEMLLIR